jgi:hypothetical protein
LAARYSRGQQRVMSYAAKRSGSNGKDRASHL